jgi:endonuclease/exonuclease/phosphatase family metal-dependent hydrolase
MRLRHLFNSLAASLLAVSTAFSAQLSVMTFNVWFAEGNSRGQEKLAEIIRIGGADIIGLQEMTNSAGMEIAQRLGYHYLQQSSGDIQVLSRFPIIGRSHDEYGALIQLKPGENVWLFNAHFTAFPYQPYDLRDGVLPMDEAAVIAASNAVHGAETTVYLNDMAGAIASDVPVFFVGDFNEPSHLDWTQAAADATARPFDLKVEYPTSKRIVDAGMTDSFREVRPDEVGDPAYTWTPGYPPPFVDSNEVFDRIDILYHSGTGVQAVDAFTMGFTKSNPNTDVAVKGYNADHQAVVVTYDLPYQCILLADFDQNCSLDASDWNTLRSNQHADLSGLTPAQSFALGDLNGDLLNNYTDFVLFKSEYEKLHGFGAFAALLAPVPEPTTVSLTAAALFYTCVRRTRRREI